MAQKPDFRKLLIAVGSALAVGGLSALLSLSGFSEYGSGTVQPSVAPPAWLFPVVRTVLYILMGVGAYLVHITTSPDRKKALIVYAVQLVLNFAWTPIFFSLKAYLLAFIWILLLWVAVLVMTVLFFKVRETAGLLQIPYLLWVTPELTWFPGW